MTATKNQTTLNVLSTSEGLDSLVSTPRKEMQRMLVTEERKQKNQTTLSLNKPKTSYRAYGAPQSSLMILKHTERGEVVEAE